MNCLRNNTKKGKGSPKHQDRGLIDNPHLGVHFQPSTPQQTDAPVMASASSDSTPMSSVTPENPVMASTSSYSTPMSSVTPENPVMAYPPHAFQQGSSQTETDVWKVEIGRNTNKTGEQTNGDVKVINAPSPSASRPKGTYELNAGVNSNDSGKQKSGSIIFKFEGQASK